MWSRFQFKVYYFSLLRQDFSEYTIQFSVNYEFSTLASGNRSFPGPVWVVYTVLIIFKSSLISSYIWADQYSAEYSRRTRADLQIFSLSSYLLSSPLVLWTQSSLNLPGLSIYPQFSWKCRVLRDHWLGRTIIGLKSFVFWL